ncbi:MAG: hypothetical protein ABJF11_02440 [Reichenbachiella sp.]|uniref:hypothetical protein n=1 Tax=Reichenbachiella sp. TaxID=2184521 RepID=UPI0032666D9D
MSTFSFNGASTTIIAGTGGISQGWDGRNHSFSADAALGVGVSLNGFSFEVNCPNCESFVDGDSITVRTVTIFFVTKTHVTWNLCGGRCRGKNSYWTGGVGLGISGTLRFSFNP